MPGDTGAGMEEELAGNRRIRGTQSLVHMLGDCWHRPGLLALELMWRWGFGIPALALLAYECARVLDRVPLSQTGIQNFSLLDPLTAAQLVQGAIGQLLPPVLAIALWLGPLLALAWAVASGLGRGLVLKRLDRHMHSAPVTMILLQLLRIIAYAAVLAGWWFSLRWAANATLGEGEPNLVAYCAWVICLSLGTFTLWALVSWIFSIAPMIAMLQDRGVFGSLAGSLHLGPLTGKLVEVNLVLSIVKLALVVLAMVFSAIPLPFATSMTGTPLYLWWAGVTVLYMAASDFFQVARLAVFIEFWRLYKGEGHPVGR